MIISHYYLQWEINQIHFFIFQKLWKHVKETIVVKTEDDDDE